MIFRSGFLRYSQLLLAIPYHQLICFHSHEYPPRSVRFNLKHLEMYESIYYPSEERKQTTPILDPIL